VTGAKCIFPQAQRFEKLYSLKEKGLIIEQVSLKSRLSYLKEF